MEERETPPLCTTLQSSTLASLLGSVVAATSVFRLVLLHRAHCHQDDLMRQLLECKNLGFGSLWVLLLTSLS